MRQHEISMEELSTPECVRLQTVNLELYSAAVEGDWETAKKIMDKDNNANLGPKLRSLRLDDQGMTVLHVAASSGRTDFVVGMVGILDLEELKQKDEDGRNVLHHVAVASDVGAAKAVVEKLPMLVQERDNQGYTPLFYAARWRLPSNAKEMVEYLYSKTNDGVYLYSQTAQDLIVAVTASGCYNVALKILFKHPRLAVATNNSGRSILYILASHPSAFDTRKKVSTGNNCEYFDIMLCIGMKYEASENVNDATKLVHFVCKELRKEKYCYVMDYFMPSDVPSTLQLATENGNFQLVKMCLKYFPPLIWKTSCRGELLLHVAVKHRQVELFNYLLGLVGNNASSYAAMEVAGVGNILHLAALLAPTPQLQSIAGPVFQLQRELEWFKAVEATVYQEQIDATNSKGKKPIDSFYAEHDNLIKDAKQWIKDTSNSCMVVGVLVATVALSFVIAVPSVKPQSEPSTLPSIPLGYHLVLTISSALTMLSSVIALMNFLSLQTSRFITEDFLAMLPKNLLRGLFSLSFALGTLMIACCAGMRLVIQDKRFNWLYISILIAGSIAFIDWARLLLLPLFFQTFRVTSEPALHIYKANESKKVFPAPRRRLMVISNYRY